MSTRSVLKIEDLIPSVLLRGGDMHLKKFIFDLVDATGLMLEETDESG
jgi:hypothetical protein